MSFILLIIFFILGLIIGSFLNVVILRYNTNKKLGGRSSCMVCQKSLLWYELVPVFSYFFLKGRCGSCKTKISIQYPLVELTSGLIFVLLFWKFQHLFYTQGLIFAFTYAYYTIIFSLLLIVSVYDIRHKIIPDTLSFIFGSFAFVGMFFFNSGVFFPHIPSFLDFLGAFAVAIPFALFWLISKGKWMGLGDAKLALGLGFFLGLTKLLVATLLAFWSGAIVGVFMIIIKALRGIKSEIPFAPFLVFGAFLSVIFNFNFFPFF